MKRLFAFLFLVVTLSVNVFGSRVFFEQETIDIPVGVSMETRNGHMYYHQDIFFEFDDGNIMSLGNFIVDGQPAQDKDFAWTANITGDLKIADGYGTLLNEEGNTKSYKLNNSHVYFDETVAGGSGTIVIYALNSNFNGRPYDCTYTINYHLSSATPSKRWDFYSAPYNITGSWSGDETPMSNSGNSPVYHKYNASLNNTDGSAALNEAAGLKFSAPQGSFGGNNPSSSGSPRDRFICMGQGTSFTIPKSYFSGMTYPRIRIKMTRFGGNLLQLTVTNGKDALGNVINNNYDIGGSDWILSGRTWDYHGEYHFQLQNKNQDFTIKVNDNQWGQWLMLLSIEVYDSYEIKTENSVLGDTYGLLNHEGAGSGVASSYWLHFYGKGERTKVGDNTVSTTGTVTCSKSDFVTDGSNLKHRYQSTVGQFGTFRMRIECYDRTNNYCTDYAWRTQAVGYMQKRGYPYTWDFTDVKTYINTENRMGRELYYGQSASNVETGSSSQELTPTTRNLWQDNGVCLSPDAGHNFLYCSGSQLWCGKEIIPELQYLAFSPGNSHREFNTALTITDEGIRFDQSKYGWWFWLVTVPSVPTNGVIYVRAHKINDDDFYTVGYHYGDETYVDVHTERLPFQTGELTNTVVAREIAVENDGSGDVIYAIPAPPRQTNVTLFFNGVIVRKISVSLDPKSVNVKGWASESRARDIDASLLPYFTGKDMRTYLVSNPDYDNLNVTLTDAGANASNCVIPANTGCVIRHYADNENNEVDMMATGDGFHLFVPDMHDTSGKFADVTTNNDYMIPMLNGSDKVPHSGTYNGQDMVNYVLTYKYYKFNGSTISGPFSGDEKFYRVYSGKTIKLRPNSAYMQLPASEVMPEGSGSAPRAPMFTFVFEDGIQQTTGIDDLNMAGLYENTPKAGESAAWYTLSGQKLVGRPMQRGFYIVNGKKVMVK